MLQYCPSLEGQAVGVWVGGKTIVGGLLGALVGVEVAKKSLGWSA